MKRIQAHFGKHGIIWLIIALGFINAFIARFKDTTPAQRTQMQTMEWSVAYAQITAGGMIAWVAYLKRPKDSEDDDDDDAPPSPAPQPAPVAIAPPPSTT
ncbi:MAG TPA: hypothetical protein VGG34_01390 [Opitutaceae bacterium]|jgi:hypothetical protein